MSDNSQASETTKLCYVRTCWKVWPLFCLFIKPLDPGGQIAGEY